MNSPVTQAPTTIQVKLEGETVQKTKRGACGGGDGCNDGCDGGGCERNCINDNIFGSRRSTLIFFFRIECSFLVICIVFLGNSILNEYWLRSRFLGTINIDVASYLRGVPFLSSGILIGHLTKTTNS
ncbi:hypothetical protein BpHYR1_000612 [Brachionus plicatilis]|uniref:Uncharacterized protein n=1 Tax=Brachionus plicatilis TaxID=10195 RepID=A0A3M7R6R5_BRAPC|nr:hypothetical protein BpHYR1_000612 [Brachionus plicatilis]